MHDNILYHVLLSHAECVPSLSTSVLGMRTGGIRLERKYLPLVEAIEQNQGAAAANRVRTRLKQMKSFPLTPQSDESSS